jgi:hypothetical protein
MYQAIRGEICYLSMMEVSATCRFKVVSYKTCGYS